MHFAGSGVALKVISDDEQVGLRDRTIISLPVPSGRHRLYLRERRKQVSAALISHLQHQDEIEHICRYEFGRGLWSTGPRPPLVELWQEPWRTSRQRKSFTRTDARLFTPMVHEDLDPYYETLDKEIREIDNSKSSASVVHSFKATREWYQDVSMELQGTQATGGHLHR